MSKALCSTPSRVATMVLYSIVATREGVFARYLLFKQGY